MKKRKYIITALIIFLVCSTIYNIFDKVREASEKQNAKAFYQLTHSFKQPKTSSDKDYLYISVSLSDNKVLISATREPSGQGNVRLYDGSTGKLLQTFNNPKTNSTNTNQFGHSVSLSGNKVLISATGSPDVGGTVYLYDGSTGKLLQTFNDPKTNSTNQFGHSVSLSDNRIVISATGSPDVGGTVYLYDGSTGKLLQTFNDPKTNSTNQFGDSVSVSGNKILIGASGAAYPYDNSKDSAGAAYLYDGSTGKLLQTFKNPKAVDKDKFGYSVSLSGNKVLIGAWEEPSGGGSAYLFNGLTGKLLQTFNDPKIYNNDDDFGMFGYSVSLSGNKILIGALGVSYYAGAAYLYDGSTGKLLQTFNGPKEIPGNRFGYSVSLSGNKILIGASDDTDRVSAAYLYQLSPSFLGKADITGK